MAYSALYRRFRPDAFEGVFGQDAAVRTLRNQVRDGRIAHAYIFTGPRGVGKTTVARIFARAINCEHPHEGEPCGECDSCRAAGGQTSLDITEIDAASSGDIAQIRELREQIKYPPTMGRYRVYIIDEAHAITNDAFGALLKTLEEPPPYVVFILATTEAHRLPVTIVSRCQRFDFVRLDTHIISGVLRSVLERAGASFTDEAVAIVSRAAEGGMRDALTIADQCIGFAEGEVNADTVAEVLGTADPRRLRELATGMMRREPDKALSRLGALLDDGKDPVVLARDLVALLRNAIVTAQSPEAAEKLDLPEETVSFLRALHDDSGQMQLLRAAELLLAAQAQMRYAPQPRVVLEMTVLRVTSPQADDGTDALLARVAELEKLVAQGVPAAQPKARAERSAAPEKEKSAPVEKRAAPRPAGSTSGQKIWQALRERVAREDVRLFAMIKDAKYVAFGNGVLRFAVSPGQEVYAQVLQMKVHAEKMEALLTELAGEPCKGEPFVPSPGQSVGEEGNADLAEAAIELFGRDKVTIET